MVKVLEEKMTVIERVQFENQDGLKKELDDLKEHTKKAETDLEEKIKQVRAQYYKRFQPFRIVIDLQYNLK